VQEVGDSQSVVKELGFDIIMFKVQLGLPPLSKLVLRSKGEMSEEQLEAIAAKATNPGILMKVLLNSAVHAKRFQTKMGFGTVILDMDYALTPAVRMCFLKEVITNDLGSHYLECELAH
jgi:hypothetical protein